KDPLELAREFNRFGEIAVIDLDAALKKGDNRELIKAICKECDVRVGGGIRDEAVARDYLKAGAKRLIIGTMATPEFLGKFSPQQMMVALDHKGEI
ncbi:HisA/HisF-related TIM barrel protein, partial [Acinetobacter baumannii]